MGVVRLINCFEVPAERDREFLAMFEEMNDYMAARPGFLSNRLHRSLSPDPRFRFVNYVEWESSRHLQAARDERFDELRTRILAAGFLSTHALYEIVQERRYGDESTSAWKDPADGEPLTAGLRDDASGRRLA